ncbi:hypothetical protein Lalb_Chr21g0316171 [Lupinus albus]|uniref:Uncharacterized protein n=1 Tax=Lupinus albus TaxID=3870 RepID=A0A6A4NML3_LUPAL|nr:hypothetical protein Lalb_Chr21g0316171 [Lupinus albus]
MYVCKSDFFRGKKRRGNLCNFIKNWRCVIDLNLCSIIDFEYSTQVRGGLNYTLIYINNIYHSKLKLNTS